MTGPRNQPAPQLKGRYSNRLDRAPCELDPLLPTEQIQQNKHPLVRLQKREYSNLLAQRAADHPHARAWCEPTRLWQLDQPIAFARTDLSDHIIRNVRRLFAVHHEPPHARGPSCIPPATNHPHKQIAGEQRRCAYDLATTTADLLAQPGTIKFEAIQAKTMHREVLAVRLHFSAAPQHGAPSTCCTLVIASVATIAGVLDRWRVSQFAWSEFLLNIPMRTSVRGRIAESALQTCHCAVNGALTPTRNASKSILGSSAEGFAVGDVKWTR